MADVRHLWSTTFLVVGMSALIGYFSVGAATHQWKDLPVLCIAIGGGCLIVGAIFFLVSAWRTRPRLYISKIGLIRQESVGDPKENVYAIRVQVYNQPKTGYETARAVTARVSFFDLVTRDQILEKDGSWSHQSFLSIYAQTLVAPECDITASTPGDKWKRMSPIDIALQWIGETQLYAWNQQIAHEGMKTYPIDRHTVGVRVEIDSPGLRRRHGCFVLSRGVNGQAPTITDFETAMGSC